MRWEARIIGSDLLGFSLAVDAAVNAGIGIGEGKDMGQLLLGGGDATGVLAEENIRQLGGQHGAALLDQLAVSDDVDGDIGIDIAEDVHIQLDVGVDLDDVLLAHLAAVAVLDDGNRAIQLVQMEQVVDLHAATGGDVVNDYTVFDGIDVHACSINRWNYK